MTFVCVAGGGMTMTAAVLAASVEVEGVKHWQAEIDEEFLHATFTETIAAGDGPVLKRFLNMTTAGAWSATVIATNATGQTWTDYHFDLLFPPAQASTPGDGVDFTLPQDPCATIGAFQVCSGTWMVAPDSLWVQFNQANAGAPAGVVRPGESVSMVFEFTIAAPPANLPISFTIVQHYSIPEPTSLVPVGLASVGAARLTTRRRMRFRCCHG